MKIKISSSIRSWFPVYLIYIASKAKNLAAINKSQTLMQAAIVRCLYVNESLLMSWIVTIHNVTDVDVFLCYFTATRRWYNVDSPLIYFFFVYEWDCIFI